MNKGQLSDKPEFTPETLEYIERASSGKRAALGQFFTPRSLREELLFKLPRFHRPKVLDPACGTGEFLLSAREYFVDPELYCWEIDPELAEIARRLVPEARIEVVDSLRKPFKEEFDVVVGNPPYFEFKPDKAIAEKYREVIKGRVNIYALFIYLGVKVLKPGGYLAYVVSSSMNNGAYFKKLREFIIENCDILYLKRLDDPYIFSDPSYTVNHTFQLLVLKKAANTGRYVFRHGRHLIFSEKASELARFFQGAKTLRELGYTVRTGKVVWNKHRDKLTNNPSEGVLLVWAHNIKPGRLTLENRVDKPQYIKWPIRLADRGPAIVVNRVIGHPNNPSIEAALIPPGILFVAENHVNVIYPPPSTTMSELEEIVRQLNSEQIRKVVSWIIGNTQLSKTELEELIPISLARGFHEK